MSLQTLNHISPPRPTPLRHALASPPNTITALDSENVISTRLTTLLFAHLRSSSRAKASARLVVPGTQLNIFFVLAHDAPLQSTPVDEPEDDVAQILLQMLSENLSLSLLSRSRTNTSDKETREWDRYTLDIFACFQNGYEKFRNPTDFLEAGGRMLLFRILLTATYQ